MRPSLDNGNDIYTAEKEIQWHVNTGSSTIHAKRLPGRFRRFKWLAASGWLIFFLLPYLRWDERQAVLFDIPARQFHFFALTVHPQDVWTLTFVMLFLATLLMLTTVIAGRAFCGYGCFQTVWTDVFTWVEDTLEGPPKARYQLNAAPWSLRKLRIKLSKHTLWLIIGMLTGVSFAAWFTDVYQLWPDLLTLQAHKAAWTTLALITLGAYVFAGFMREQMCLWLCPYSRIQGVMYEADSLLPAYDEQRGEPRTKLGKSSHQHSGACVDCDQCLAVCPTGVDIREGQQAGCITCGLCIDACDSVMDKLQRPRGLIRYASQNQLQHSPGKRLLKRPQVILSSLLMFTSLAATAYGLNTMSEVEFSVVAARQPMYIIMSDNSIENRYQVRIFNKSGQDQHYHLRLSDTPNLSTDDVLASVAVKSGKMHVTDVALRLPPSTFQSRKTDISFELYRDNNSVPVAMYRSHFTTPTQ